MQFMSDTWLVSSEQIPGLLATGPTLPQALRDAAHAIEDLALAVAMEIADGHKTKPIFREV